MARTSAPPAAEGTVAPLTAPVGAAVVCGAALVVPLGYVPNLSSVFAEPKLALLSVAGAVGIAGWILAWATASPWRPRLARGVCAAVAALLVTTVIATLAAYARGTPGAPYAPFEIGRLLAVVGVALATAQAALDPLWRRRLLTSIHVGAGLVALIGILQHLQILPLALPVISVPGSTFGNRNIAAEAVAMSIPFGLGWLALSGCGAGGGGAGEPRRDAPVAILLLLALELIYLGATRTRGAWLGAASAIAVFYGLRRRAVPRAALGIALALGAAALVSAVIPGRVIPRDLADAKRFEPGEHVVREALDLTSPVVRTRLGLWRRTLAMYRSHPWLGVGPGNFVVFFPLYAEPGARADGVLSVAVVPRRAHEDLLERLAETGPLGLAALLAVYGVGIAIAVRRGRRADGRVTSDGARAPAEAARRREGAALAAAAAASLVALFACGLTGFPLAMPGTSLLFGVALGFLAAEGGAGAASSSASSSWGLAASGGAPRRVAAGLVAAMIAVGGVVVSARMIARSYWLARARSALGAGNHPGLGPQGALAALGRAARNDNGGFEVTLETAFVLVRLGRFNEAQAAVDHALTLEPHSANAWALRAEAAWGAGDAPRAAAAARHATTILADYPAALAMRARAEARLGNAPAAHEARTHLATLAAAGDEQARHQLDTLAPDDGVRP